MLENELTVINRINHHAIITASSTNELGISGPRRYTTFDQLEAQRQRHEKTCVEMFELVVVGSESYNLIAKHLAIVENESHNLIENFLTI